MADSTQRDSTQRLIRDLFDAASDLPADQRKAWVERSAQGNPEVISSVLRLLNASSASGQGFLAEPAFKRAKPALQEGMMIGPYRVLRELGSGGMGVVYLAMRSDEVYRRLAAVKVIRPELKSNPLRNRFLQEREILARLDHANIARIIDGGETAEGLPYFVMDYVDGVALDRYCRENRATMQERLHLFRQTCEAVQYLHDNNVLHRDLKPENILVTHNGQVKLLDFGVSKLDGEFTSNMTTGLPILTAGYASPEQITSKTVTRASDIYSLGVVLYELLTGVRPLKFDGLGLPEILTTVTTQIPPKPSTQQPLPDEADPGRLLASMRPQLAGDLDCIVLMALRKEPERRYPSAAEFAADIQRFQQGRAVIARGDGKMYLLGKTTRRHRMKIAAVVLIGVSLSGAGVASYFAYQEYNRNQFLENELKQNKVNAEHAKTVPGPESQAQVRRDIDRFVADYEKRSPAMLESHLVPRAVTTHLVTQSLSYFSEVQAVAGNDPPTVAALGRAYLAVARTQWSLDRKSLNDPQKALDTCKIAVKALTATEKLKDDPSVNDVLTQIRAQVEANPAAREGLRGNQ